MLDNKRSEANAKTLYCIFNYVSPNKFNKITTYKYAKEAWDVLLVTHKGTSTMKFSKLQMLTTIFESIKMNENETFSKF